MTSYFLILLAIFCFAGQFAFTKLYEGAIRQTTVTSLVMLVVTSAIGTVLYFCVGGFQIEFSLFSVIWAILLALVMIPYYMIGIKVLSLGSLAIYGMFMMLGGMLVPFFYGVCFLKESLSVAQIIGTVLLTVFIVLQSLCQFDTQKEEDGGRSAKDKVLFLVLCLVIFFLNGLTGVIAKAHQIGEDAVNEISFTVISCAFLLLFSLILLGFNLIRKSREKVDQIKTTLNIKPLCIMALIGATAYTGNFLHLIAAADVPASVQFPLVSGGVIVLSALTSAFVFKERLSRKEWLSIVGVFASTVLFAF